MTEEVSLPSGVIVGRPKKSAGKKASGPKTIGVRSTPEWEDWIDRAARH
jgi:hypothetical protein